jgi:hypothetical protein
VLAVPVVLKGDACNAGTPGKMSGGTQRAALPFSRHYDVSLDDSFLLLRKGGGTGATVGPPQIIVVQRWDEELKHLASTK